MFKGRYSTKNEADVYTKHEVENSDFDTVLNAVYEGTDDYSKPQLEDLCPRFFNDTSGSWVRITSGSNFDKITNKWNSLYNGE
tara:strand:- start:328 stop:576 length:249 start_codon:yes stop_codon:yes gene_type:complete